jgi:hypothetical protein
MFKSCLAAIAAAVVLSACVGPIKYQEGRSLSDVPETYSPVALVSVSESTMMGDKDIPDPKYGAIIERAREAIAETFKQKGVEVSPTTDNVNLLIHAKVYWMPWNVILGGHMNVFLKVHDKSGAELFTGVFGRNFTLFDLAGKGEMGVVDLVAGNAATNVINELAKKKPSS